MSTTLPSRMAALCMYSRVRGTGTCAATPRRERDRLGDGRGPHLVPVRERDADGGAGEELQPALHDGIEHRLAYRRRVADDCSAFRRSRSAAPAPRRARARALQASSPAPTRMRACGRRALSSSFRWNEGCDRPFGVSALCETLYEPKSPRRHGPIAPCLSSQAEVEVSRSLDHNAVEADSTCVPSHAGSA